MGDTNGVDIAQGTHEAVLMRAGCLLEQVYGKMFPASDALEGLYIEKAPDEHLTEASRSRYR